ncbi:M56 family metallopeptidase [Chitinophaga rhizophila]|uniref:M48 family metalloprotease n=1 Tax=Chitinophaga rhizophila TaxID=2866212 RepID=A0ABS7GAY3_9BACT|nr:M56 family metallopeptidase [Chitinophaga rhizophila]MBW8684833.1 M48 family metalloprotease [Chitinophaga rhizophila]
MTAQLPFTADLIQAFGWALLHSFWQAFFIFACLRLVLYLWPQAGASIKYNLSFISLAGIFSWFTVTLWQQIEGVRRVHAAAQFMIETGIRQSTAVEVPVIYKSQSQLTSLFPTLEMWFPVLVAIYVAGVAVMIIKLTGDLLQLQQIKRTQVFPIDEAWEHHLHKLKSQLHIPRRVKLLISQYIQVPVMIGCIRPVILLPVAMFNNLTAEQLEAILLHELAHIKRNDYLLNIFQSIVETILFFNPFVWWISKNIRLEREHCCDDIVLRHQVQPLHYAKALVALEEYRLTVNALAMAAADNKQHLFHRIKRIMEMKTKNINYTQKLLAVMIIAVGLVSIAWLNPTNKEEQPDKSTPVAAPVASPIAPASSTPIVAHFINVAHYLTDTVPASATNRQRAKEEAARASMEAADAGLEAAKKAMENIDWKQINAEISNAMKEVDFKKINEEVSKAMKEVNWNEINTEVSKALKEINWDEINKEIKKDLKNTNGELVDPQIIQESIRMGMEGAKIALSTLSSEEVRAEMRKGMEEAKKGMEEARKAMNSDEVKAAMLEARKEIEKAQQEIKNSQKHIKKQIIIKNKNGVIQKMENDDDDLTIDESTSSKYKDLISRMEKDKLIDTNKEFTVEKKDDVLTINGVRQPEAVLQKYADVIGKADALTINGKKGTLNINVNEH